ncbi:MAG: DUF1153 domain-containing protein [Myxococcales bacterium FL481]|nr:MAG: DUF1153 domain-containing protein [Myxococcales bacterium FL481]
MAEDNLKGVQRWTAKRRMALVLGEIKGEITMIEAARKQGLKVAELEDWKERFLTSGQDGLRARPKDEHALKNEQIRRLKQRVGEDGHGHHEGGDEKPPFRPDDVKRLREAVSGVSERRACRRTVGVARPSVRAALAAGRKKPRFNELLVAKTRRLIKDHPTVGCGRCSSSVMVWKPTRFPEDPLVQRITPAQALGHLALRGDRC